MISHAVDVRTRDGQLVEHIPAGEPIELTGDYLVVAPCVCSEDDVDDSPWGSANLTPCGPNCAIHGGNCAS